MVGRTGWKNAEQVCEVYAVFHKNLANNINQAKRWDRKVRKQIAAQLRKDLKSKIRSGRASATGKSERTLHKELEKNLPVLVQKVFEQRVAAEKKHNRRNRRS